MIDPFSPYQNRVLKIQDYLAAFSNKKRDTTCQYKHHTHTPFALCKEIIGKIPNLQSANSILVMFNIEFILELNELDMSDKIVYYYTTNQLLAGFAKKIVPHCVIVTNLKDIDMKFDVVIGNPPYQDPRSKTVKLWFEFTKKVLPLANDYVCFVTPNAWFFEPTGLKIKSTATAMATGSIIHADIENVNKHFPMVGEDIGYWIWSPIPSQTGTVTANWFGTVESRSYRYDGSGAATNTASAIRSGIASKLAAKMNTSVRVEGLQCMRWKCGPDSVGLQDKLSPTQLGNSTYPVRLTASQTMYHHDKIGIFGICVNISGYYYVPGKDDKYMPITDDDTGQSFLKIKCENMEQALNVKSFLTSKLYRCYNDVLVAKAFNNYALARMPFLGRDKRWTDNEIYTYFNLSQEEIDFVEKSIK